MLAALVTTAGLGAFAFLEFRTTDRAVDEEAAGHARAACDLFAQSEEAARVDSDGRYAAALLLLDKAIIESGRAAEANAGFTSLNEAVQAVHTAAHRRSPGPWSDALDAAQAACRDSSG